jgi:hypothetical protein
MSCRRFSSPDPSGNLLANQNRVPDAAQKSCGPCQNGRAVQTKRHCWNHNRRRIGRVMNGGVLNLVRDAHWVPALGVTRYTIV